jgi:hypothetical protein
MGSTPGSRERWKWISGSEAYPSISFPTTVPPFFYKRTVVKEMEESPDPMAGSNQLPFLS